MTSAVTIVLSVLGILAVACFGVVCLFGGIGLIVFFRDQISGFFKLDSDEAPEPAFMDQHPDQGITSDFHMTHLGKITFSSSPVDLEEESPIKEVSEFNGKSPIYGAAWLPQSAFNMVLNSHECTLNVKSSYLGWYILVNDKEVRIKNRVQPPVYSARGEEIHENAFNIRSCHDDMLLEWTVHPMFLIFPDKGDNTSVSYPEYREMAVEFASIIDHLPVGEKTKITIQLRVNIPPHTYETLADGSLYITPPEQGFLSRMAQGWKPDRGSLNRTSSKKLIELVERQGGL